MEPPTPVGGATPGSTGIKEGIMELVKFKNRTVTLPKSYDAFFRKGDDFLLFKSDDELILKQVQYPEIKRKALSPSKKPPMTLEEICEIVREVRRKTRKKN